MMASNMRPFRALPTLCSATHARPPAAAAAAAAPRQARRSLTMSTSTSTIIHRSRPTRCPSSPSSLLIRTKYAAAPFHTHPTAKRRASNNDEEIPTSAPTTDFARMDMLGSIPPPSTSIDVCSSDGFTLDNGTSIYGGNGVLLVGQEAFVWQPWAASGSGEMRLLNAKGQWEVPAAAWGLLELLWPRPDLLILGLGPDMRPLSPATRRHLSGLGLRVEVLNTRNAASQFNMLATERGVDNIAAALIPIGWKEGVGASWE